VQWLGWPATPGPGTVEFLLRGRGFFFLEMNTRLQSSIRSPSWSRLDLVAGRSRVAAAAPLSFHPEQRRRRGTPSSAASTPRTRPAAVLPSPGTVTGDGGHPGPRRAMDGGYEAGDDVSPTTTPDRQARRVGPRRQSAIRPMTRRSAEVPPRGRADHRPAPGDPGPHDFVSARHSTVWVEQRLELPRRRRAGGAVDGRRAVAGGPRRRRWYSVPRPGVETRLPTRRRDGAAAGTATGSGTVTSQMQGTVVRVLVAVGDIVEAGQGVCAVEAMKMRSVLKCGVATGRWPRSRWPPAAGPGR